MEDKAIERALETLCSRPELLEKLDRRLKYEILNRKTRVVGIGKKLTALYVSGLISIRHEGE